MGNQVFKKGRKKRSVKSLNCEVVEFTFFLSLNCKSLPFRKIHQPNEPKNQGSISRVPENGGFGKRVTEVDRLREVTQNSGVCPANRVHFRSRLLQRSLVGRSTGANGLVSTVDAFDLVLVPPRLSHGLSNSSALGMLDCLNEASFDVKSSLSLSVHWFLRGETSAARKVSQPAISSTRSRLVSSRLFREWVRNNDCR